MARPDFSSVDEYLSGQPQRAILEQVRSAIMNATSLVEEKISYRIPAYRLGPNRCVFYFAGWKEHWSLYPVTPALLEQFAQDLAPYEVEKGTIRFPYVDPPPVYLITALAAFRAGEAR